MDTIRLVLDQVSRDYSADQAARFEMINYFCEIARRDATTGAGGVVLEGDELNRFYRRTDGGSGPGKATLEQSHEVVVTPGVGVAMMPDDIHAIAVTGDKPTLHLHMYGRALETLNERVGYDLEAGTCDYYRSQGHAVN